MAYLSAMTVERARAIGRAQAIKSVSLGLVIAYLMMAWLCRDVAWLGDVSYWTNLVFAAAVMFGCAYVYGGWVGTAILEHQRNPGWVGVQYGLLTLLTAPFLAGWVGFFQAGFFHADTFIVDTYQNLFFNFVAKPVTMVGVFGLLPALLVGMWFGNSIKRAGQK